MKNYILILLTLVLVACGTDSQHFKIDGRLLNLNQGEFFVYSTDGLLQKIDTIKVEAGRFSYKTPCTEPGTLVIVFPNYSQTPVFAEPGKSVEIKGDASHLKELTVKGTKTNKLMNDFREQVATASPPEAKKRAEVFIKDHPQSLVAVYLLSTYFINTAMPDYDKAAKLAAAIQQAQPDNNAIKLLRSQLDNIKKSTDQKKLPAFKAKDIYGKTVTNKNLGNDDAIICIWATWEYESASIHRSIKSIIKERALTPTKVISISLDPDIKECKRCVERDEIEWPVICDGKMMEGYMVNKLAVASVPECIVVSKGKIKKRVYSSTELRKALQK